MARRTATLRSVRRAGNGVETVYTNGPAGGGRTWPSARDVLAVASILVPRDSVRPTVAYEVAP